MIRAYFCGVGNITKHGKDTIQFRVFSTKELRVIIDYLDKYPLLTQKRADYELFKQVVEIMAKKEHITSEGMRRIVGIRSSINKGLTDELKVAFPDITPVPRPKVVDQEIQDPN